MFYFYVHIEIQNRLFYNHSLTLFITLTLGSRLMWSAWAHEVKRMCLDVKHTFTNEGECKGWSPMIPSAFPLGSYIRAKVTNVLSLGWKNKQAPN
jgi:hypothetical protein